MNADDAKKLREPFPAELVGKLPKPTKKDNPKGKCSECGGYHGLPAVHLDYVGHAAVTDRLLQVDPAWSWEPLARDPNTGAPLLVPNPGGLGDEPQGLWINLTVCGVTRPGFGGGKNAKECISDALRNAAMRFGVGLDLWSKEDLRDEALSEGETSAASSQRGGSAGPVAPGTLPSPSESAFKQPQRPQPTDGGQPGEVIIGFGKNAGKKIKDLPGRSLAWYAGDDFQPKDPHMKRVKAAAQIYQQEQAA